MSLRTNYPNITRVWCPKAIFHSLPTPTDETEEEGKKDNYHRNHIQREWGGLKLAGEGVSEQVTKTSSEIAYTLVSTSRAKALEF